MDHPFVDGNKRIGAHVMLTLLALNGIELTYTQKELADTFLALAAGSSAMRTSWPGCCGIRSKRISRRTPLASGAFFLTGPEGRAIISLNDIIIRY